MKRRRYEDDDRDIHIHIKNRGCLSGCGSPLP
jgi:hypothetical protein